MKTRQVDRCLIMGGALVLTLAMSLMSTLGQFTARAAPPDQPPRLLTPSHSTTIALTSGNGVVVAVNRVNNSISVIRVRAGGKDTGRLLAEIDVGREPRCVALSPDDRTAYVTNAIDGTVSVVNLVAYREVKKIRVGTEPRGCAITPNGRRLFVANHTAGTVSVINTITRRVIDTLRLGGNPTAVAITNDHDNKDNDERVFVTDFFARLIRGGPGEASDTGRQGLVHTFAVGNPDAVKRITLSPLENSGFAADRTNFCPQTIPAPMVLHDDIFCPDVNAAPGSAAITADPQGVFPNQFFSALIRGNRLFLPNVGAARTAGQIQRQRAGARLCGQRERTQRGNAGACESQCADRDRDAARGCHRQPRPPVRE